MPRGPRKLVIEFGAKSLTHYGGVYLLHRFFSRIGFKDALGRELRLAQRNNRYSVGEMFLALLYPMVLGLERIETTQLLRQNGVFQYLTGLPSYPMLPACGGFCCAPPPKCFQSCALCTTAFCVDSRFDRGRRRESSSASTPPCWWFMENRNKHASATTPSSEGVLPTIRCFASRASTAISGRGTAARRRSYRQRRARSSQSLLRQGSRGPQIDHSPRRQGVLRSWPG